MVGRSEQREALRAQGRLGRRRRAGHGWRRRQELVEKAFDDLPADDLGADVARRIELPLHDGMAGFGEIRHVVLLARQRHRDEKAIDGVIALLSVRLAVDHDYAVEEPLDERADGLQARAGKDRELVGSAARETGDQRAEPEREVVVLRNLQIVVAEEHRCGQPQGIFFDNHGIIESCMLRESDVAAAFAFAENLYHRGGRQRVGTRPDQDARAV
ncbi:MAG: hypothetical protein E6J88_19515, partial [Deltaproteobacteria bacterium]